MRPTGDYDLLEVNLDARLSIDGHYAYEIHRDYSISTRNLPRNLHDLPKSLRPGPDCTIQVF